MQKQSLPARALSLLSVGVLLASGVALPLLAGMASASTYVGEDWEPPTGDAAWSKTAIPRVGQDCTVALFGMCSLEVNAQVSGAPVSASRLVIEDVPPPGYVVSFYFRNNDPTPTSSSWFTMHFGNATWARVNLTYGSGNQVVLSTNAQSTGPLATPAGAAWTYSGKTWYRLVLKANLLDGTLRAEARTATGSLLAAGPSLALPNGGKVAAVGFEGSYSGANPVTQPPQKMNYDLFALADASAPSAPRLLTALPGPDLGQVTVTWQAPSDDGGVPILHYNVYRGASAATVTTLVGNTTNLSFVASGMANGESYYYAARAVSAAGEGGQSNVALGTTLNAPSAPRALSAPVGPNVGEVRLAWQAPANNGGAPVANYTIYRGTAPGEATFLARVGNVLSYTDAHLPNGTTWHYNVTATNAVGEGPSSATASGAPRPDTATAPTSLVVRPDPWWTQQPREVNFTYAVAASQCPPAQACPVPHEWRIYQDGSPAGPDGILLASGTGTHDGHAGWTTYNVSTIVTPTGLDGTHRLKIAVNAREASTEWRVASTLFRNGLPEPDVACDPAPAFSTYLMPGIAPAPGPGWQYPKTYAYELNGTLGAYRAVFVDGCPANGPLGPGDGFHEFGYGGILLNQSAVGKTLQIPDSTGNLVSFVVGTDGDGNGVIGDSPLDCLQGPHRLQANVTCPPDAAGKLVVLLLPASGPNLPTSQDPIWGRAYTCVDIPRIKTECVPLEAGPHQGNGGGSSIGYRPDQSPQNKMGDDWERHANDTAKGLDWIIGIVHDQEFPAGRPCVADCVGRGLGDGLKNLQEFRWNTIPLGAFRPCECLPTIFPNARDHDADEWEDGPEHAYWNDEENDVHLEHPAWSVLYASPFDPDATNNPDDDLTLNPLHDPDNDNDGLLDGVEFNDWQSYPEFADSDCALDLRPCSPPGPSFHSPHLGKPGTGDHVEDANESAAWGAGWNTDHDGDGIRNNLLDPDADADGLLDGLEFPRSVGGTCALLCTDPAKFDTDADGLLDGANVNVAAGDYRIRLFVPAGVAYGHAAGSYTFYGEAAALTNRTDPDSDDDGLPDGWEVKYQLDPFLDDAGSDGDADGMNNLQEYAYGCKAWPCPATPVHWGGTNPMNADSDGDLLLDGSEDANQDGTKQQDETSPIEPDTDHDGLKDGAELNNGANPSSPVQLDTDDDGLTDYQEVVTYAAKNVRADRANSDECCNATGQDTLSDYQEVVVYKTNPSGLDANNDGLPDGWDTDGDGLADGRDAHPTRYDAPPPPRRELPPLDPQQPARDAYVTFSQHYVDVLVADAHGAEADVELVEVKVILTGTVDGVANSVVKLREEARRLDEGVWGARIPLPPKMSSSHRQEFALTVVTADGGTTGSTQGEAYGKTFTRSMSQVGWNDQNDPANDWGVLKVHDDMPARTTTASGFNGASLVPDVPDPWALDPTALFAEFGNFTVYRLKGGAVLASDLPNVTAEMGNDTSALALAHPMNATAGENGSVTLAFTYFEDAFEEVDPLAEPGVYASMAGGGSNGQRSPKFIHTGFRKAWDGLVGVTKAGQDVAMREGASFLFGSDDPRAKGAIAGDVVSGILVYGDVRDCYFKDEAITVALGCVGIALTFVGPQADGPFAAFKAGVKTIVGIPTVGPKMAVKFVKEVKDVALKKNVDESFRFLLDHCAVLSWARKHTAQATDFTRLQHAVPGATLNALKNSLDDAVALSADVAKAAPEALDEVDKYDTTAKQILRHWESPNSLYKDGKGLGDMSAVMGMVRASECVSCKPNLGQVVKNLHDMDGVGGLDDAWNRVDGWKWRLKHESAGGKWGTVFEILQAGMLKRGELHVKYGGETVQLGLDYVDEKIKREINGQIIEAQMDAWAKLPDSMGAKRIGTEFKGGRAAAEGEDIEAQMEKQIIVVNDLALNHPTIYAKEIHWRFHIPPKPEAISVAKSLMDKHKQTGVTVRFFTADGTEVAIV